MSLSLDACWTQNHLVEWLLEYVWVDWFYHPHALCQISCFAFTLIPYLQCQIIFGYSPGIFLCCSANVDVVCSFSPLFICWDLILRTMILCSNQWVRRVEQGKFSLWLNVKLELLGLRLCQLSSYLDWTWHYRVMDGFHWRLAFLWCCYDRSSTKTWKFSIS